MSAKQTATATKAKAPDAVFPSIAATPPQTSDQITTIVMRPIVIDDMDSLARIAKMMAESEMFKDAKTAARAGVKIMLGMELGIGPLAAMRGIMVGDDGQITLAANLQAALVQRSGRFNYKVKTHDSELCAIDWFERNKKGDWDLLGTTSLSINEAKGAGMHMQSQKGGGSTEKYTWKMFPSDMLYARCITRGVKRFCPSVTNGITIYDPDELSGLPDGRLESVEVITGDTSDFTALQAMEGKAVDTSALQTANPPAPVQTAPAPSTPQNQPSTTPAPQTTTGAGSTTETPSNASPAASGGVVGSGTGTTTERDPMKNPTRDEAIKTFQGWAGKMKRLTEVDPATNKVPYPEKLQLITGALAVNGAKVNDEVDIIITKTVTLRNCFCNITGAPREAIPGEVE